MLQGFHQKQSPQNNQSTFNLIGGYRFSYQVLF